MSNTQRKINAHRRNFYLKLLGDEELYFDIGANLGNRIQPIIFDKKTIVAVEPQPFCINHLRAKFGDLIKIEQVGLSADEGQLTMHLANAHTVSTISEKFMSKTIESGRFSKIYWDKTITIKSVTFDMLIEKHGIPGFAKIDVEGYENEVLKGLSIPIPKLSFEFTLPEMKQEFLSCFDELKRIYNNDFYFNYSHGENLVYGFDDYLHISDFNHMLNDDKFNSYGFGDIYVSKELN